jgi:predicted lipoprotein with Yx(FWY)xxD motif
LSVKGQSSCRTSFSKTAHSGRGHILLEEDFPHMLASKTVHKVLPLAVAAAMALVAIAAEAGPNLAVADHPELGAVLVDGSGNTLYAFTPDADGASTCYDTCAQNWPPLVADGDVTVGEGLSLELAGTVARDDGSQQVTYGGWPLYTFVGDTEAGQANGQGRNDVWYAVAPDGTLVGAAVAGDDTDVAALMEEGAAVFRRICAACHGANGDQALAEHVAILANNRRLENERLVLRRIVHGGGYMPGFGSVLSDREVAAVATFVRNSWGNEYGPVGEEDAAATR